MTTSRKSSNGQLGGNPQLLRIVASGTVFVTQSLTLSEYPEESAVVRAQNVDRARGGSACNVLTYLSQFRGVDTMLVAPLGGNTEGKALMRELQRSGISTKYCKVWENAGVPNAWVLHSTQSSTRTVINHNPLPDITHEEFVSLLGPLLVPENYSFNDPSPIPSPLSLSSLSGHPPPLPTTPTSPAPFDWLHFEGRSVKTTLSNLTGIDGLARDRNWRGHCVFSLDVSRKSRQGVEALIPYADVIFFSKSYALSQSSSYTTPRPFLLSMTNIAAPHALLVAHWGASGAALLSVPTREYLQSSGWVDEAALSPHKVPVISKTDRERAKALGYGDETTGAVRSSDVRGMMTTKEDVDAVRSVRSGSDFWATGHGSMSASSSSAFTAFSSGLRSHPAWSPIEEGTDEQSQMDMIRGTPQGHRRHHDDIQQEGEGGAASDSDKTARQRREGSDGVDGESGQAFDEVAAQEAFIAGMIYALSRRILPGAPYSPLGSNNPNVVDPNANRGKWKLEDCLRFASELAGRRARKKDSTGLIDEMAVAGWFNP